ncbi:hypothetical protein BFN03_06765 [Rhodococcus sp. WMMA185]|uniref:hypothetical protein n=1 Tax=Rhodococcus sp. WMMA185 TaxID=679318 RepID=UPI000877EA4D|nr:hypothetical protein [Rhodococcus sp. WMMA185]AOW92503.1 hypothetical protein BFN03_06765 [Rhodococcus sp. WMMA185]
MTTLRTRQMAATAATALPLFALVIAKLAWGSGLPPVVASHWSGIRPDRFSDTDTYFWSVLAVCIGATVIAGIVVSTSRADQALWLSATILAGWTAASVWIASVAATLRAGSPEAATLGFWALLPVLGIVGAIAAVALLYRISRNERYGPAPTLPDPLGPDERAAWTGYARGRWASALALTVTAAAVMSALLGALWLVAAFLVLAVVGGAFASITVQVDRTGLSVASWNVRWRRIPLDSIAQAQVAVIRPGDWGGWGYRFTPRGTAVVIRGGEGIVLTHNDGRRFAVTVDSPEQGAALLNSLVTPRPAS